MFSGKFTDDSAASPARQIASASGRDGGAGISSTCLLVVEPIGLNGWDCRSRDDLPIRLATRQEIVPYTVAPMFYSILSEAILSFASLKR